MDKQYNPFAHYQGSQKCPCGQFLTVTEEKKGYLCTPCAAEKMLAYLPPKESLRPTA